MLCHVHGCRDPQCNMICVHLKCGTLFSLVCATVLLLMRGPTRPFPRKWLPDRTLAVGLDSKGTNCPSPVLLCAVEAVEGELGSLLQAKMNWAGRHWGIYTKASAKAASDPGSSRLSPITARTGAESAIPGSCCVRIHVVYHYCVLCVWLSQGFRP